MGLGKAYSNSLVAYLFLIRWFGKCWYIHNLLKYEFDLEFDVSALILLVLRHVSSGQIPVTYPTTAPEIAIPELDGKTAKMYR